MIMLSKKSSIYAILLVLGIALVAGCTGTASNAVKSGDNVTVEYTGWFDNGTIFDTSNATIAQQAGIYDPESTYEPISFIVGNDEVIGGFDNATIGMKVGESKNITITPDQAYGEYDPTLIQPIPLSVLEEANITPHVNDTLYYNFDPVRVDHIVYNSTDVNNSSVYIDFNHPLAGKNLHFRLTVLQIQAVKTT